MLRSLLRGRAIAGGLITLAAAAAAATTVVIASAPASGNGAETATSFSGSSSGAIVTSHNSGTGQAISASGSTGASTGVIYATTAAAGSTAIRGYASSTSLTRSYGVIGVSKNGYGVEALTYSPSSLALFALNAAVSGSAIKGQSPGNAITGISSKANGLVGQTTFNPLPSTSSFAGVLGQDLSTPSPSGTPFTNVGVKGTSLTGFGVQGTSTNFIGVAGSSTNLYGVYGASTKSYGVVGSSNNSYAVVGSSTNSYGVFGSSSNSVGVFAEGGATPRPDATTLPNANNIYTAALAVKGTGGGPLIIARGTGFGDAMSLDNSGNLRIAGNLYANSSTVGTPGSPLVVHRIATGRQVGTYAAEQTQRTIEDFGQGRLVNGQAYVRLDPTFAATIDQHASYLVFITPEGPSRGVFVTAKSLRGFSVRENPGGNSTIAFSYRIVAKPFGTDAPRLPLINLPAPGLNPPQPRPITLPLPRNQMRP